jgi:hypothetical protein
MMDRKTVVAAGLIVLAGMVIGCQSEVLQPTEARRPTDPASVKLYQKEPKKYEDLGFVEVASDMLHAKGNQADDVVAQLKTKAAAKGANGVYLTSPGGKGMYRVGAYYGDEYYVFPFRDRPTKAAIGKAIYVIEQ